MLKVTQLISSLILNLFKLVLVPLPGDPTHTHTHTYILVKTHLAIP